jgi:hypothetical protein
MPRCYISAPWAACPDDSRTHRTIPRSSPVPRLLQAHRRGGNLTKGPPWSCATPSRRQCI